VIEGVDMTLAEIHRATPFASFCGYFKVKQTEVFHTTDETDLPLNNPCLLFRPKPVRNNSKKPQLW
jgi:hypothetical protein